jgi:hypothetical protein
MASWLGLQPRLDLIPHKLGDRNYALAMFLNLLSKRVELIKGSADLAVEFKNEMYRFLPTEQVDFAQQQNLWEMVGLLLDGFVEQLHHESTK